MIKSAIESKLSAILDVNNQNIFKIPTYQREYAWTNKQCQELIDDILDNDLNYFLGSTIFIEDNNITQIIDGQQRLTSLSLLLISIRKRMNDIDASKYFFEISSINKMLSNSNQARLELQKQNKNKEDYQYLLTNEKIIAGVGNNTPKNHGNRRIACNFKLFNDILKNFSDQEIKNIYDKVLGLSFVKITTDDTQSAYLLFDAMNNRGLALTPFDLIKNKFIAIGGDDNEWSNLIKYLGDNYANQEQFLRNNYNAFRAEYSNLPLPLNNVNNIKYSFAKATKSNLIKIYESLMKKNTVSTFTSVLLERAKTYSNILGVENDLSTSSEMINILTEYRRAEATSSYILVLFLIYKQTDLNLLDDELNRLLNYILKFSIRRNFTNIPSTGAVPGIMMSIIEKINKSTTSNYNEICNIILDELKSKAASDAILELVLNGDVYIDNKDMTRYALCNLLDVTIKSIPNTKEIPVTLDLWRTVKDKPVWTIEHIFPEGDNIPQSWVDMIANGNETLAKKYQVDYVHKFGNLTLTGYNSELSNDSFEIKKDKVIDGYKVGYNNGLSLNDDIYKKDKWTINDIKDRTKTIVAKIMKKLDISSI